MVIYKSSDIVKRATQLADIENSDFISFSEKIALLNESYTSLYQKLANKGDNVFKRTIRTNEKEIILPPDFWQLKAVLLNVNGLITQVLRRPANQDLTKLSYDMENGYLRINGNQQNAEVCIEYYPVPKTLTFPNEPRELDYTNVVDVYQNLFLTADTGLFILSAIDDPNVQENINLDPLQYTEIDIEDDYVVFKSNTDEGYAYYNLLTGEYFTSSISEPPALYKNKMFYFSGDKLYFIDTRDVAFEQLPEGIPTEDVKFLILSNKLESYVALKTNGKVVKDGEELELRKGITKIQSRKPNIVTCISDTSYFVNINMTTDLASEDMADYAILSATDGNDNIGYGYLGRRLGKKYIISYFQDTVLNFPNNMYFTLLAYQLALAFKSKQGSDTSQLLGLYEQAESTFFDTLTTDDWNNVRITNCY